MTCVQDVFLIVTIHSPRQKSNREQGNFRKQSLKTSTVSASCCLVLVLSHTSEMTLLHTQLRVSNKMSGEGSRTLTLAISYFLFPPFQDSERVDQ